MLPLECVCGPDCHKARRERQKTTDTAQAPRTVQSTLGAAVCEGVCVCVCVCVSLRPVCVCLWVRARVRLCLRLCLCLYLCLCLCVCVYVRVRVCVCGSLCLGLCRRFVFVFVSLDLDPCSLSGWVWVGDNSREALPQISLGGFGCRLPPSFPLAPFWTRNGMGGWRTPGAWRYPMPHTPPEANPSLTQFPASTLP